MNKMENLELFLDNNKYITSAIYDDYEKFGYMDYQEFELDLHFMCENIYNIKIVRDPKSTKEYYNKMCFKWPKVTLITMLKNKGFKKNYAKYTKEMLINELYYNNIKIKDAWNNTED